MSHFVYTVYENYKNGQGHTLPFFTHSAFHLSHLKEAQGTEYCDVDE